MRCRNVTSGLHPVDLKRRISISGNNWALSSFRRSDRRGLRIFRDMLRRLPELDLYDLECVQSFLQEHPDVGRQMKVSKPFRDDFFQGWELGIDHVVAQMEEAESHHDGNALFRSQRVCRVLASMASFVRWPFGHPACPYRIQKIALLAGFHQAEDLGFCEIGRSMGIVLGRLISNFVHVEIDIWDYRSVLQVQYVEAFPYIAYLIQSRIPPDLNRFVGHMERDWMINLEDTVQKLKVEAEVKGADGRNPHASEAWRASLLTHVPTAIMGKIIYLADHQHSLAQYALWRNQDVLNGPLGVSLWPQWQCRFESAAD